MSDESNVNKKHFDLNLIFFLVISIFLLGLFIFSIQDVLNPLIIFALLVLITYPQKKNLFLNSIFRASILLFILWTLIKLGSVLTPFIVALFLAYIFNPIVIKLQQKKLSRGLSIAIIFLIMIGLGVAIFMLIVPTLIEQVGILINQLPTLAQNIQYWIEHNLVDFLENIGIPRNNLESFFKENLLPKIETTLNAIFTGLLSLIGNVGIILNQIINLFIIPVLTFYFLKDFEKIKNTMLNLFHPDNQVKVMNIATEIDIILGKYFRGAVIVALINGIVVTSLLTIVGVEFSIALGIFSALMSLIPYFGVLISFTIGFIISLFSGLSGWSLIWVPIIYFGENLLESSIFYPKIVGSQIGLHPILLMLSLFVFSMFFGFVGLLIAVPATSIIVLFFEKYLENRNSQINVSVREVN